MNHELRVQLESYHVLKEKSRYYCFLSRTTLIIYRVVVVGFELAIFRSALNPRCIPYAMPCAPVLSVQQYDPLPSRLQYWEKVYVFPPATKEDKAAERAKFVAEAFPAFCKNQEKFLLKQGGKFVNGSAVRWEKKCEIRGAQETVFPIFVWFVARYV